MRLRLRPSGAGRLNWAHQLDFVGPRVATSVWGWGLLVVGLCLALQGADQVRSLQQAQADEQASLARLQRAEHQRQVAAAPLRAASGAQAAWSSEALQSAQGVVRLLAYPWASVVNRVEQAALQEQALLLSFSLNQDLPLTDARAAVAVRLTAAVPTDEAALRWCQAHGDGAQLLSRERLSTPAPSPQGDYPWRAEVSWIGGSHDRP
ncbi:MAG: hypothetical protein ACM3VZ_13465 [Acidobacteriota bacterium]